ncbi:MAG: flagellar hook-associated protein FlgL [Nitrospirales bacterium]|nr:flagellar hook-associated protein FlgL [Nitrospirales bacterium]
MRVSSTMLFDQLRKALQNGVSDLADKNLSLATGKRINKPSDDPVGAARALDYKLSISRNDQFIRDIGQAETFLDATDKTLTSAQDSVASLSKLLAGGLNNTSSSDKAYYAEQAANYRDFIQSMSNTKLGDRYIFSGFQTDQEAFTFNAATNHYDYNGDLGQITTAVGNGITSQMNIQGPSAFGVTMPVSAPTALADGTPVSYSQTTDPATGVSTMTIGIGTAGDPAYDTFTVSNVMDIANYMSYAWKSQDVDGTALDVTSAVSDLKAAHRLQALAAPLNAASSRMLEAQSEIGTREAFLDNQQTWLEQNSLNLENSRAATEDADINQTAVDIKSAELALDALRTSAANILSQSLLDFLQ